MYRKSFNCISSFILCVSFLFSAYSDIDRLQEQSMFDDALKLCGEPKKSKRINRNSILIIIKTLLLINPYDS